MTGSPTLTTQNKPINPAVNPALQGNVLGKGTVGGSTGPTKPTLPTTGRDPVNVWTGSVALETTRQRARGRSGSGGFLSALIQQRDEMKQSSPFLSAITLFCLKFDSDRLFSCYAGQ
jgi:hypothetical protein